MLSGYILSFVYNNPDDVKPVRSHLNFLMIRLVRIYPVYFVALLFLGAFVLLNPDFAANYRIPEQRWSIGAFIASLILVQNWAHFLPTCWNAPAWSLSAEWLAYLAFPLFQTITRWPRRILTPVLLSGCCLALFAALVMLNGQPNPGLTGTPGLARMAFEFTCGCLLFTAMRNGLPRLNAWADFAGCALLSVAVVFGGTMIWLALPAFGVILLLAAQDRGPISAALGLPVVVWLGKISYSLYIMHWIVLQVGKWELSGLRLAEVPARDIILAGLCLACATCTYKWIELPARARGRAWARRLAGRTTPPPSTLAVNPTSQPLS